MPIKRNEKSTWRVAYPVASLPLAWRITPNYRRANTVLIRRTETPDGGGVPGIEINLL